MTPMKKKYGQTALYLLLLVAVIAVMGLTRRCSSSTPLPMMTQGDSAGDTIDVAIMYGPLSYYIYSDTLGGLNYDILLEMERQTGMPIHLWPVVSLPDALAKLEQGKFDMLASLPSDNTVKERFLTTPSIFLDRLVLVQPADSMGEIKVKSALDLGSDTIHIQKDSPAGARLANLSNEIDSPIPVKEETELSEEYLCMKVATGDFPLAVVNEKIARSMKEKYPHLSYDNPVSFTQFQVWLLPKSDTLLLNRVDSWLKEYLESPHYRSLLKRYTE